MTSPAPTVVLVGPPGAGKSTVGTKVARRLGLEFRDSDEIIAAQFGMPCGRVFAAVGEPEFRRIEQEVIAQALQEPGVLALGGGAVVTAATRQALAGHAVVWLDVSVTEGLRRTATGDRPVLNAQDPRRRYADLLAQRRPWYEEVASLRVPTHERPLGRVVAEICAFAESAAP